MSDQRSVNIQLLIAYGRGRASVVYTAAYTWAAAHVALDRCIAEHGRWVQARIITDRTGPAPAV